MPRPLDGIYGFMSDRRMGLTQEAMGGGADGEHALECNCRRQEIPGVRESVGAFEPIETD